MGQIVNETFPPISRRRQTHGRQFQPRNSRRWPWTAVWTPVGSRARQTNGTLTLTLPKPVTFDVVSLQEAVDIAASALNLRH